MSVSATARIAELDGLLAGTSITSLTLSTSAETITIRRHAEVAGPAPAEAGCSFSACALCSGVFLLRHPMRDAPLVEVGQIVQAGAVLGLLRAGPLLLHVTAPRPGIVEAIVAADLAVVGYGAELVRLASEEDD